MTRHGKIARLPRAVREELNERLDNGESGVHLAKWLNGLKEVKTVLRENFGGRSIRPQNLSEWKCGGFREWQARQEAVEQAREMSAQAKELLEATEYKFSDYLATVLAARYAKVLSGWDGRVTEEFSTQLRAMRSMCLDVAELRRGDHGRERVALEGRRLNQNRERTDREVYEMFKRWAFQPAVRDCLCQAWETPEEKEERLEEIFGLRQGEEEEEGDDHEGAGETGGTPVPLTKAVGGETPAPLPGETIRVDPSRSDQEQAGASASANAATADGSVFAEASACAKATAYKSADESADRTADGAAAAGETPAPLPREAIRVDPSISEQGEGEEDGVDNGGTAAAGGTVGPLAAPAEAGGTPAPLPTAAIRVNQEAGATGSVPDCPLGRG
jgi:hypothetical protein